MAKYYGENPYFERRACEKNCCVQIVARLLPKPLLLKAVPAFLKVRQSGGIYGRDATVSALGRNRPKR